MESQYYDIGQLASGDAVIVSLSGGAATVHLVDSENFANFKNGANYNYSGGWTDQSSLQLTVPHPGWWHVIVDFGEYRGIVKSHVLVRPGWRN
ncbi:MAG: DUF1883 domain-containing protein [Bacillota bacterium]